MSPIDLERVAFGARSEGGLESIEPSDLATTGQRKVFDSHPPPCFSPCPGLFLALYSSHQQVNSYKIIGFK
jgi:hypothetical protein